MDNKKVIGIAAVLVLIAGFFWYKSKSNTTDNSGTGTDTSKTNDATKIGFPFSIDIKYLNTITNGLYKDSKSGKEYLLGSSNGYISLYSGIVGCNYDSNTGEFISTIGTKSTKTNQATQNDFPYSLDVSKIQKLSNNSLIYTDNGIKYNISFIGNYYYLTSSVVNTSATNKSIPRYKYDINGNFLSILNNVIGTI